MVRKDRIRKTLDHEEPDRVGRDFGSTPTSGIHVSCVAALRDHYGLESRPVKVCEPYQMLGEVEDDLLDALGVDTIALPSPKTIFGFANENWKDFRAPWDQELLVSEHFNATEDTNGDLLLYPEGDVSAPPSGRMPAGGFFFDTIIRQDPIDNDSLDPEDNLEEFQPISDNDLEHYRKHVQNLVSSRRAIVGGIGGTAFGDIALVPAPFLKHPKGIRDVEEWYVSTLTRQDYIHEVFEQECAIATENLARVHAVVGEAIDVLFVCGTDFGTQQSTFCSTETFCSLYAPYYARINAWVHEHTTWKTLKHSCGAVESFIPHFIESGFDILNPVQCSAAGMDAQTLKNQYGDRIVFWGGGVDTQRTLPFGTPQEVREEVLKRCEIFAPNGGFVFNTVHNVQAQTPVENLVAMVDALDEYDG